jgi:phosphatidylinositol kinase/protein kinase (PI-3  family)
MTRPEKVLVIQGDAEHCRKKLRVLNLNGTVLEVLSSDTVARRQMNLDELITTLVVRWQ